MRLLLLVVPKVQLVIHADVHKDIRVGIPGGAFTQMFMWAFVWAHWFPLSRYSRYGTHSMQTVGFLKIHYL